MFISTGSRPVLTVNSVPAHYPKNVNGQKSICNSKVRNVQKMFGSPLCCKGWSARATPKVACDRGQTTEQTELVGLRLKWIYFYILNITRREPSERARSLKHFEWDCSGVRAGYLRWYVWLAGRPCRGEDLGSIFILRTGICLGFFFVLKKVVGLANFSNFFETILRKHLSKPLKIRFF